jgi:large subunit ribosomal protein L29|tara:strand:+ start:53 stop:274 length:222 start_codon:yes stop_codon:yes gene_type:complete
VIKKRELLDLDMNSAELKLTEHYEKLRALRFQKSMQQIENPLEIKFLKKEIAQLKTLLNEFKLGLRGDNASND